MSLFFSANQFEEEYKPSKLRNWEVSKWFPATPCQNYGKTHVLSNERGHLLPGVPRSTFMPWGGFVGTWDLPNKITRDISRELSAPRRDRIEMWEAHCQRSARKGAQIKQSKNKPLKSEVSVCSISIKSTQESSDIRETQAKSIEEESPEPIEEVPKIQCPIHDQI